MPSTIFVSYSHKDIEKEPWLERLEMYLAPIRQGANVEIWQDKDIPTGTRWRDEIARAIERSNIAILLVGPGFLASEFITNEELPAILRSSEGRGLKIYPLIIGYSLYSRSVLKEFQSFNDPQKPLEALPSPEQNKVLNELSMKIEEHLRRGSAVSVQPAPGSGSPVNAMKKIQQHLQTTWKAFSAQCNRRNELVEHMRSRLDIKERLEYEKFFFRYFSVMNAEEKFEHKQIRSLTEGPMYAGNLAMLDLLSNTPQAFQDLPRLAELQQHLVFWLNKYEKVFVNTPEMCVLYTGVEDAVPFPRGVEADIAKWLHNHH